MCIYTYIYICRDPWSKFRFLVSRVVRRARGNQVPAVGWQFKGSFKVSSGTASWYRSNCGTDLDDSELASPVCRATYNELTQAHLVGLTYTRWPEFSLCDSSNLQSWSHLHTPSRSIVSHTSNSMVPYSYSYSIYSFTQNIAIVWSHIHTPIRSIVSHTLNILQNGIGFSIAYFKCSNSMVPCS